MVIFETTKSALTVYKTTTGTLQYIKDKVVNKP